MPGARGSVATHLRILRWCGFCKLHRRNNSILISIHEFYRLLSLAYTSTYIVQECIYAYLVSSDMDRLARVMFLLLCHITSIAKQIMFHTRGADIETMIDDFNDPLYNQADERSQLLLKQTARSATVLVRCYSSTAVLTCILWIVFPMIDHYKGKHVEFFFWMYKLNADEYFVFEMTIVYSFLVTTLVGIANTTMDAFMGTILYQSKTQLKILRLNLEQLPDKCWKMKNDSGEEYNAVLSREFLRCLEHYKKICKTIKDLEDIFGTAILIQFTIGGWILCMAAYKLVDLNVFSVEFASMCLFLFCILLELFLYCYYGNEAFAESDRLLVSIYTMNWLETPISFRKSLVILMERTKRPLKPAAGNIIPLSLDTFVTIIKSSYTFYAVLRQTKN